MNTYHTNHQIHVKLKFASGLFVHITVAFSVIESSCKHKSVREKGPSFEDILNIRRRGVE